MSYPIAVVFPVYNRADKLEAALKGWSKVRGAENAIFVFRVEPQCDASVAVCEAVDFAEAHTYVNGTRLGHALNVYCSMNTAFLRLDYAIHALDDYVPATDLLELHAWHRDGYFNDSTVLGMSSSRDVSAPFGDFGGVWRCQLIGALPGFHRHKWNRLAERWAEATDQGWWEWVNREFLQGGPGYDMLFPARSHAMDIGDWHPHNGGFQAEVPPQKYWEVKTWRERSVGFSREWVPLEGR